MFECVSVFLILAGNSLAAVSVHPQFEKVSGFWGRSGSITSGCRFLSLLDLF